MQISVFHVVLDAVDRLDRFRPVVHPVSAYVCAGTLDVPSLNAAYAESQNLDAAWCAPAARSTSVGDLLVVHGDAPDWSEAEVHLVDVFGFTRLDLDGAALIRSNAPRAATAFSLES